MEENKQGNLFPLWQRMFVFFIPVIIPLHTYLASKKFELGGKELRDEYYRIWQYGYLFHLLLLIVGLLIYRFNS